jgi:DNA-directed RNA polymerase sigma subunit (sigma70/sigma32)
MPQKSYQHDDTTTAWVMAKLSQREKRVIRLRFGIGVGVHSRKALSRRFSLTPERIRAIEVKAIRKLQYPGLRWLWTLTGASG